MNYYNLSDLIIRLKLAYKCHLTSVKVLKNKFTIKFLDILFKIGIIRGFYILENENNILVYLKYKNKKPTIYNIKIISKPSKRVYWNLNLLSKNYRKHAISNFYIISTSKGLITSNEAILQYSISGEILCEIKL
jgi:ribosomal protein S8